MRTTQTRKRSRSSNYGSRNKRRRIMRRVRRAGPRSIGINNLGQRIRDIKQRWRKGRKSSYKRALWNYSSFIPRFVVQGSGSVNATTPASNTTYAYSTYQVMPSLFNVANWSAGFDGQDVPTTLTGPVIVRGGEEKFTIASEATESIEYKLQLVYVKRGGAMLSAGTYSKATWPLATSLDANNETVKVVKEWQGTLTYGGGSATFVYKPKIRLHKKDDFTNKVESLHWAVYIGNTVTAESQAVVLQQDSSVTVSYMDYHL